MARRAVDGSEVAGLESNFSGADTQGRACSRVSIVAPATASAPPYRVVDYLRTALARRLTAIAFLGGERLNGIDSRAVLGVEAFEG